MDSELISSFVWLIAEVAFIFVFLIIRSKLVNLIYCLTEPDKETSAMIIFGSWFFWVMIALWVSLYATVDLIRVIERW
jgi:hypothetical protein